MPEKSGSLCINSALNVNLKPNVTNSKVSPQNLCSHQMIPPSQVIDLTSPILCPAGKLSMSASTTSDTSGQNKASMSATDSRDRVDIALIASKWKGELDKWYEENPDLMKFSVFCLSKALASDVKEARALGEQYLILRFTGNTISFKLNIGPTVEKTELTKVRFLAIVLRYLHNAAQSESDPESKGFKSSALVGRVEFGPENPLFKYRFLLGEGFHLNHDLFEGEEQQNLFLLGCILLDFLSCHSRKNPRYERCKQSKTFVEYIRSSAAKTGATLLAAMRHSGIYWSAVNQKLPLLEAKAQMFKIHPFGTPSIKIRLGRRIKKLPTKDDLTNLNNIEDRLGGV